MHRCETTYLGLEREKVCRLCALFAGGGCPAGRKRCQLTSVLVVACPAADGGTNPEPGEIHRSALPMDIVRLRLALRKPNS